MFLWDFLSDIAQVSLKQRFLRSHFLPGRLSENSNPVTRYYFIYRTLYASLRNLPKYFWIAIA